MKKQNKPTGSITLQSTSPSRQAMAALAAQAAQAAAAAAASLYA